GSVSRVRGFGPRTAHWSARSREGFGVLIGNELSRRRPAVRRPVVWPKDVSRSSRFLPISPNIPLLWGFSRLDRSKQHICAERPFSPLRKKELLSGLALRARAV